MKFLVALWIALASVSTLPPSASVAAWKAREATNTWSSSREEPAVGSPTRVAHEEAQGAREVASLPQSRIVEGLTRSSAPVARALALASERTTKAYRAHSLRERGEVSHASAARGGVLHHYSTAPPITMTAQRPARA